MLNGIHYDEPEVPHWINKICEKVTDYLLKTDKPYKYIGILLKLWKWIILVNCSIMQKTGAGLICSTSCHWDTIADSNIYKKFCLFDKDIAFVAWPKEKSKDNVNKTMHCTVHVFAISI